METKGNGNFYFPEFKKEFKAQFMMQQKFSEEAKIFLELDVGNDFAKFLIEKHNETRDSIKCSVRGELESGMNLQIEEVYFIGADIKNFLAVLKFKVFSNIILGEREFKNESKEEEIHFFITNFEFIGNEKTIFPKGGWKLNRGRINIEGYEILFNQFENYDKIMKALKKEFKDMGAFTTEIVIKTPLKNHEAIKEIIENVCYILSFAKGVDIIPSKCFHVKNNKKVWGEEVNVGKRPFRGGDYLIHQLPPENIFDFVEKVYPNYTKYKNDFGLNVLFNLYTAMKSAFYMELRCLIGYVILETLGENLQNFYHEEGDPIKGSIKWKLKDFKKILPINNNLSDADIEKIIDQISYDKPSLQDSIERVKRDFKFLYRPEDKKLFEYRKYFVHQGKFPPKTDSVEIYRNIISFVDRIILSILNYNGEFCDISRGYKIEDMKYGD